MPENGEREGCLRYSRPSQGGGEARAAWTAGGGTQAAQAPQGVAEAKNRKQTSIKIKGGLKFLRETPTSKRPILLGRSLGLRETASRPT